MENDTNFTHGSINETHGSINDTRRSTAVPILMFAGGAVGNIIAIVVLSQSGSRQGRKTSAFYSMVCGLAVTDLLGTCLASPLTIVRNALQNRHLCEFQSFLLLFFGVAGLSIMCAMSAERYMAICCPYTYQRWGVDRRFAQKTLLLIYVSNVAFCVLPAMGIASSKLQHSRTWCFIHDWERAPGARSTASVAYSFLYGGVSLVLIVATIVLNLFVCGTLLLMRQRTVQRPVTRASVRERWRALSSAAETQMIAVLVMTSAVVLTCSAPLVVRVFANQLTQVNDFAADLFAIRIASVNPILDPWIYILLRRTLFRRILSVCKTICQTRKGKVVSTPQRHLLGPEFTKDTHVFTQLLCNANIITQLPAAVTFTSDDDTESAQPS